MQHVLHNVEEKNFKLRVFYNKAKDKNKETEERKQQLKEICTEMQSKIQVMLWKIIHLQGLYNHVLYRNTQMQEEKQ